MQCVIFVLADTHWRSGMLAVAALIIGVMLVLLAFVVYKVTKSGTTGQLSNTFGTSTMQVSLHCRCKITCLLSLVVTQKCYIIYNFLNYNIIITLLIINNY